MSPRRRIDPADRDYFRFTVPPVRPLRWGLPVTAILSAVLVAAFIGASVFLLVSHESERRTELRDASALGYTKGFMTTYTTLDPFHANDYADRILAQATGEFSQQFNEKLNEIVVQVARAEPTTGRVLEAGVQRWNDDGSVDILVAAQVTTTTPDGKTTIDSGSRWVVTTIEEGQQWKISRLIQVI